MSNPDNGQASAGADGAMTTTDSTTTVDTKGQQAATGTQQGEDPGKGKEGQQGQTTDTTTDAAAKAEADAKAKEEADNAVPAEYEPFTVPEGFTLEGERLEFAKTLFKDLGLSQSRAQKAIEAFCKADGENAATRQAFLESEHQQRIENWGKEAKEQFGTKYDEAVADARVGVAAVNRPELLKAFDEQGWGNHPELIRAFAFFGQLAKGSGLKGMGAEGSKPDRSQIPIENRLYPNMK